MCAENIFYSVNRLIYLVLVTLLGMKGCFFWAPDLIASAWFSGVLLLRRPAVKMYDFLKQASILNCCGSLKISVIGFVHACRG